MFCFLLHWRCLIKKCSIFLLAVIFYFIRNTSDRPDGCCWCYWWQGKWRISQNEVSSWWISSFLVDVVFYCKRSASVLPLSYYLLIFWHFGYFCRKIPGEVGDLHERILLLQNELETVKNHMESERSAREQLAVLVQTLSCKGATDLIITEWYVLPVFTFIFLFTLLNYF